MRFAKKKNKKNILFTTSLYIERLYIQYGELLNGRKEERQSKTQGFVDIKLLNFLWEIKLSRKSAVAQYHNFTKGLGVLLNDKVFSTRYLHRRCANQKTASRYYSLNTFSSLHVPWEPQNKVSTLSKYELMFI